MNFYLKKVHLGISAITFLLIIACVFIPEELIIENGQWFYAVQFLVIFFTLLKSKNNYIYFFSPSFLCLFYLNLNFFLGHMVISRGLGFDLKYTQAFKDFESVSFITAFFIFSNLMVFLSISFKDFNSVIKTKFVKTNLKLVNKLKILILFLILFILGFVKIDLSLVGGEGDFSYVFKFSVVIIIVYLISDFKSKIKYLLYLFIIIFFFVGSLSSKREFIYVLILILFFEFLRNRISIVIKFKQILYSLIIFAALFYLVVSASIVRGYGNFDVDDSFEASKYVIEYVYSDFAINALVANFELNYLYGNSSNAINYVYTGEENYLFGSTFFKFLFIPFPRSIFPGKPISMIDIYTNKFDPNFRSIGGSYPVIIYAESYWNFGLLAFPFLYFIFRLFNKLYLKTVYLILNSKISTYSVFLIFMYTTFIQFIRGSGFDLWLLYCILPLPFIKILIKILRLNNPFGKNING
jgi:hypothetical protein